LPAVLSNISYLLCNSESEYEIIYLWLI